jgi:hypothetical protein
MPTVPRYESQVGLDAAPLIQNKVDVPRGAFELLPNAIEKAGDLASKIANAKDKAQADSEKEANRVRLLQIEHEFEKKKINLLNDADNGYLFKKGNDAIGSVESVQKDFEGFATEMKKLGVNPTLMNGIDLLSRQYANRIDKDVQTHLGQETIRLSQETTKGFIVTSLKSAALTGQDEEAAQVQILKAQKAKLDELKGAGIINPDDPQSRPFVEGELLSVASTGHTGVITAMIDEKQPQIASDYFKKYEKEFTPEDKSKVMKLLKDGKDLGNAQSVADSIWDMDLNRSDAIDQVRKKTKNPEVRAEAEKMLAWRYSQEATNRSEMNNQAYIDAADIVEKNPNVLPRVSVPPSIYNQLTPPQRNALEKRLTDPQTDPKMWMDMTEMIKKDPLALSKMTRAKFESDFWSKASKPDRRKLEELWLKRANAKEIKLTEFMGPQAQIETSLRSFGYIPKTGSLSKMNAKQMELYYKFNSAFSQQLEDFERDKGKKATQNERQELIDKLLGDSVRQGGFSIFGEVYGGDKSPRIIADPAKIKVDIDDISQVLKDGYKSLLRSNGRSVSDASLVRLHEAMLTGNKQERDKILKGK